MLIMLLFVMMMMMMAELGRLEELMGAWERAKEAPYLHGVVLTTKSLVSRVKLLARAYLPRMCLRSRRSWLPP